MNKKFMYLAVLPMACSTPTPQYQNGPTFPKYEFHGVRVWADLDSSEVVKILEIPEIASRPKVTSISYYGPLTINKPIDTIKVVVDWQTDPAMDSYGSEYYLTKKDQKWKIVDSSRWVE